MSERPSIIPESMHHNGNDIDREIARAQDIASKMDTSNLDPGEVQGLIDAVDRIDSEWLGHFRPDFEALMENANIATGALGDLIDAMGRLQR